MKQSGFSLVSLMVGTTISLVSVLAVLALYKGLVTQSLGDGSNGALGRARDTGQLASGLLAVEMELQQAGFGIQSGGAPAAVNADLVLVQNATWSADGQTLGGGAAGIPASAPGVSGNALVWGYNLNPATTASYECRALVAYGGDVELGQPDSLGLLVPSDPAACSDSSAGAVWATVEWNKVADLLVQALAPASRGSTFQAWGGDACWPYGKAAAVDAKGSTFSTSAQVLLQLQSAAMGTNTAAAVCLPNIS